MRKTMLSFAELLGEETSIEATEVRPAIQCIREYPETDLSLKELKEYGFDVEEVSDFTWDMKNTYPKEFEPEYKGERMLLCTIMYKRGHLTEEEYQAVLKEEVVAGYVKNGEYPDNLLYKVCGVEVNYFQYSRKEAKFPSGLILDYTYIGSYDQNASVKYNGEEYDMVNFLANYVLEHKELNVFGYTDENLENLEDDDDSEFRSLDYDVCEYTTYAWRVFYAAAGIIDIQTVVNIYAEKKKAAEEDKKRREKEEAERKYDSEYGKRCEESDRNKIYSKISLNQILSKGGKKKLESILRTEFPNWEYFHVIKGGYLGGYPYIEVTTKAMQTPTGVRPVKYTVHLTR